MNAEIRHILADGVETPDSIEKICQVTDSLALARHKHPGQKNNLDALCRRYMVDNSQRQLHGALLDAEILADVFLLMTGGQTQLFGASDDQDKGTKARGSEQQLQPVEPSGLQVIRADPEELQAHEQFVTLLAEKSGATPIWRQIGSLAAANSDE